MGNVCNAERGNISQLEDFPKNMTALVVGKNKELNITTEYPMVRHYKDKTVILEVFYTFVLFSCLTFRGVNICDVLNRYQMSKALRKVISLKLLGVDMCGKVLSIGKGVSPDSIDYSVGDIVCGNSTFCPEFSGCYSTYCAVPSNHICKLPEGVSEMQGAAYGMISTLAYQMFMNFLPELGNEMNMENKDLLKGKSILIIGASGGVGSFCVLLGAKFFGAKIYAVSSEKNHEYVRKLGAEVCIDYKTTKFEDVVAEDENLEAILDTVGGKEYSSRSRKLLKKRGKKYVTISGGHGTATGSAFNFALSKVKKNFNFLQQRSDGPQYGSILKWMEKDDVLESISCELYAFEDCDKVHEIIKSHRAVGRFVLDVKSVEKSQKENIPEVILECL